MSRRSSCTWLGPTTSGSSWQSTSPASMRRLATSCRPTPGLKVTRNGAHRPENSRQHISGVRTYFTRKVKSNATYECLYVCMYCTVQTVHSVHPVDARIRITEYTECCPVRFLIFCSISTVFSSWLACGGR